MPASRLTSTARRLTGPKCRPRPRRRRGAARSTGTATPSPTRLRQAGALALPPYIERPAGPTAQDAADYQTVFARDEGAVAAPTAGLHFTPALLDALAARGVLPDHAHAACRRRHVSAGARRGRRRPHACTPNAARSPPPPPQRSMRPAPPAAGSWRSARPACGCWRRRPTDGLVAPFAGETELFIRPATLPRRRPAADQFPSAALDAVHAGLRICRGTSACAPPTRTPSPRNTGSTRTAMPALLERA